MTMLAGHKCVRMLAGGALAAAMFGTYATAQAPETDTKTAPEVTETIYLVNTTGLNDLNEIQTALRNNFPRTKIYGVAGQYAITVRDKEDEMPAIKKMVAELDRPKKIYRVTYNISDVENGKRTGTQHYSLVVAMGAKGVLKEGKRVPLVIGVTGEGAGSGSSQVQYIDVGVNIEASIEGQGLRTKVEISSVADEKSGVGAQDPVVQQTMMESTSSLTAGKAVVLGSIEIPGTTRHQDIEVVTETMAQ
jgi:type II secretory pathway component GspD/PulD (secretin)